MSIRPELLDELLSGYRKCEDLFGEEGLFKQLKKVLGELVECALGAEPSEHLGAGAQTTDFGIPGRRGDIRG